MKKRSSYSARAHTATRRSILPCDSSSERADLPSARADVSSVRAAYERFGAEGWYRRFGAAYHNPHEAIVARSILAAVQEWRLDLTSVLDLAAGSGEATLALREAGARRIDAVDPHTADAYLRRTGQSAEPFTFADIAAGALSDRRYTLVVCSFALHLCDRSRLPGLMWALAQITPVLLVLTPHKRPHIRPEWGWKLADERILERVRRRRYEREKLGEVQNAKCKVQSAGRSAKCRVQNAE